MESLWGRCFPSQALMLMIPLLLAIPSPSFQTAADPSSSHTLERTVGDSVQLHLISSLSPNVREVEWSWQSEPEKQQFLVSWKPDDSGPDWYELEGKFRSSLSLTEMAVLSIRNLSTEMSGWYTANVKFHTGKSQKEVFRLCVYEPIPHPQIVIHSPINPAGWCQVSLECETPGSTENWTVTWLTEGLPRELEQSGALRPAPSSRNVNLTLPLSQVNGYLTCLVSNPVEEKNATLPLQSICLVRGSPDHKWLWRGVLPTLLMMSLAGGVYVCMRKKMQSRRGRPTLLPTEPGSAGVPQALPTEEPAGLQTGGANSHCHPDVEMSLLRHHKGGRMVEQEKEGDRLSENDMERSGGHPLSSECTPTVYTIYEKVRLSREPQEDTKVVNIDHAA